MSAVSEARRLEVNLIIHVSCYSLHSILSRREPSANEIAPHPSRAWRGKVTEVRATSGSRLRDICLHWYGQGCASHGAAVTVISGEDSDAPKHGGKSHSA